MPSHRLKGWYCHQQVCLSWWFLFFCLFVWWVFLKGIWFFICFEVFFNINTYTNIISTIASTIQREYDFENVLGIKSFITVSCQINIPDNYALIKIVDGTNKSWSFLIWNGISYSISVVINISIFVILVFFGKKN